MALWLRTLPDRLKDLDLASVPNSHDMRLITSHYACFKESSISPNLRDLHFYVYFCPFYRYILLILRIEFKKEKVLKTERRLILKEGEIGLCDPVGSIGSRSTVQELLLFLLRQSCQITI